MQSATPIDAARPTLPRRTLPRYRSLQITKSQWFPREEIVSTGFFNIQILTFHFSKLSVEFCDRKGEKINNASWSKGGKISNASWSKFIKICQTKKIIITIARNNWSISTNFITSEKWSLSIFKYFYYILYYIIIYYFTLYYIFYFIYRKCNTHNTFTMWKESLVKFYFLNYIHKNLNLQLVRVLEFWKEKVRKIFCGGNITRKQLSLT